MTSRQIEDRAFQLRTELFKLAAQFKELHQTAIADGGDFDTVSEIDGVACKLAEIHDSLPHVFVAAASR